MNKKTTYHDDGDYAEELKEARAFVLKQQDKEKVEKENEKLHHDKFYKEFNNKDQ